MVTQIQPTLPEDMTKGDLTSEFSRSYHFGGQVVHIAKPVSLYTRRGGTTHRVVDHTGMVFIVPAPGYHGCHIRVTPNDTNNPVQF